MKVNTEMPETKIKKQEEMIDILMGEVKRLKAELVNYELIKELISNKGGNFLVERRKEANQEVEAIETKKISQCWVCGLETHKLFERNRGKIGSYFCCVDCYKDIEKDNNRIQEEKEKNNQDKTKTPSRQLKTKKRVRKGISKQEAMKHSQPSKKRNKVICKDCGGEYFAKNFHAHYATHIK